MLYKNRLLRFLHNQQVERKIPNNEATPVAISEGVAFSDRFACSERRSNIVRCRVPGRFTCKATRNIFVWGRRKFVRIRVRVSVRVTHRVSDRVKRVQYRWCTVLAIQTFILFWSVDVLFLTRLES